MRKQLEILACWLLLLFLFPYIITLVWTGKVEGSSKSQEITGNKTIIEDQYTMSVMDIEEFLIGVVAAQMPADYEAEALRAQAIIARTYIYNKMGDAEEISSGNLKINYWSLSECKKQWGKDNYSDYYEKIKTAVGSTAGMIMKYEGKVIVPMFHSASSGQTRDGDEDHPYFVAVSSAWDVEMEGYLSITDWGIGDFTKYFNIDSTDGIVDTIQIVERDSSGYVTKIEAGGESYSGDSFQAILNLQSACFTIENFEGKIRIICKGIGHGYGLSQWGSNKQAKEGMTAEEILPYYYKNIQIISE